MSYVILDSSKMELLISGSWIDVSQDVINSQEVEYGIPGSTFNDRTAVTGQLKFTLKNDSTALNGKYTYTPGKQNQLVGFKTGVKVRYTLTYAGESYVKFYGRIKKIELDAENQEVKVTALDYIDVLSEYPVSDLTVQLNQTASTATKYMIDSLPIKPLATKYGDCIETFPSVFDTAKNSSRVLSEINKLCLSEVGYAYIRRDRINGETLVIEGRNSRDETTDIKQFPVSVPFSPNFLLEDGSGNLLLEDGLGNILVEEIQEASFSNDSIAQDVSYGENVSNHITITSYPRRIDSASSPVVLYSLNSRVSLAPGETKTFTGKYIDPQNLATSITAYSTISPVSGTDFTMFSSQDGTGTNLTASLIALSVRSSTQVTWTLTNSGGAAGYAYVQVRGRGIYLYENQQYVTSGSQSILDNGIKTLNIEQKYQTNSYLSADFANLVLSQEQEPRLRLNKISYLANVSDFIFNGFLNLDIGDMIRIQEDDYSINNYYFINSVKFTQNSGFIEFTWGLVDALSLDSHYWLLEDSTYGLLGETTILGL